MAKKSSDTDIILIPRGGNGTGSTATISTGADGAGTPFAFGESAKGLRDRAKPFAEYAKHQPALNEAGTNVANEAHAVAEALNAVAEANANPAPQPQPRQRQEVLKAADMTITQNLLVATASIAATQDAMTGHVSVEDMGTAAGSFNAGYDSAFELARRTNPTAIDAWVASYSKSHPLLFSACGEIKRNAAALVGDVGLVMKGVSGWGGSYRNPTEAAQKIDQNVTAIVSGTSQFAKALKEMTDNVFKACKYDDNWLPRYMANLSNATTNLGGAAVHLTNAGQSGIGSFTSAQAGVNALKHGDIAGATGYFASAINGALLAGASLLDAGQKTVDFRDQWIIDHTPKAPETEKKAADDAQAAAQDAAQDTRQADAAANEPGNASGNASGSETAGASQAARDGAGGAGASQDDYGADIIHEIDVALDGAGGSEVSSCTVNGVKYRLSNYSIVQNLLEPMILTFSMEKDDKEETQQDVIFADATSLIGKTVEVHVSTVKSSQGSAAASSRKAFVFKGIVTDVSASRATASSQSAGITAATCDCMMQNAPHCRSFENMTLRDIVTEVLKPYKDVSATVNPRFTAKIPYIVQYNQSDYAFVRMLAIRFGEWMYSTGEKFVFGEMDNTGGQAAKLEYPGGSLMSYGLSQNMSSFAFNHLTVNHYKYGDSDAIKQKAGKSEADGKLNDWTDKAYQAAQQRLSQEHVVALTAGGFDNGNDDEGADSILEQSVKIEAQGAKTGLMTVTGSSKLAMLKIGQQMLINDNVQNISGQSQDVQQKALVVTGISHFFDYRQEYSNTFAAVPSGCKHPSYSHASVHAVAPTQRAKVVDNKDEQKLGRIRVQFAWQEAQGGDMKSPWIRMAVPYAGQDRGHLFVPEEGEEVMVGFEMNNAERPYVIGALYNGGKGKPNGKWAAAGEDAGTHNNIKAIRTRGGHTIMFNDKGDAGQLEIYDNNDDTYHITLSIDDKKITIHSAGDIEIGADGNIAISAKKGISMEAGESIGVKAKDDIQAEAKKEVRIEARKKASIQTPRLENR